MTSASPQRIAADYHVHTPRRRFETAWCVDADPLANPSVAKLARRLSARIVGPPAAYRAAYTKVAEAGLQPEQPDRFVYWQFPFVAADVRAAAIGRMLARRDAPYRHGGVTLLDALGKRDFAKAWGHAFKASSGRAPGNTPARNVHRRLAPRNPLPVILHSMLTASIATGDPRPRTCIRLQPGCVRVVDNER